MAAVKKSVPGSGYGNVYVDSLIWGGTTWDPAGGPIKVYFGSGADYAAASKVHGTSQYGDYLVDASGAQAWTSGEVRAFAHATSLYEKVCGLSFAPATTVEEADILWWKTEIDFFTMGAHEPPGGRQVWGYFNPGSPGWKHRKAGGDGLNTIVHELGHGLGLAHPHDGGLNGDGTKFPGVGGSDDTGRHGHNQGIRIVMSYNTGWDRVPHDESFGAQTGLGAFDIAALQALYGENTTTADGNTTYRLPSRNAPGTGWSCIWDTGGRDTINGTRATDDVTIDLRAATLEAGSRHAGGFVSH
ncbi:hypothetical protein ACFOYU_25250 [Microvirga sp. GCM10011540]|uniref:hypothetical protein n=1 Tax=Microvirga sp. GCM10011540 TaxID=3317338 RepID=UPI003611E753